MLIELALDRDRGEHAQRGDHREPGDHARNASGRSAGEHQNSAGTAAMLPPPVM